MSTPCDPKEPGFSAFHKLRGIFLLIQFVKVGTSTGSVADLLGNYLSSWFRLQLNHAVTIGRDILWRVLVIVYTWRGSNIRLISARKATRRERQQYAG